jgi:hypothetical protein
MASFMLRRGLNCIWGFHLALNTQEVDEIKLDLRCIAVSA